MNGTFAGRPCSKKIDSFCHFAFPAVLEKIEEYTGEPHQFQKLFANNPGLVDPEFRIELMDKTGVAMSILTPLPELGNTPSVEKNSEQSAQVARVCNEAMAELVAEYPDRFRGGAMIPTADQSKMIEELEYAVKQLGLVGAMLGAGPTARAWDDEYWEPLWSKAEELDIPIWMHPSRSGGIPDYSFEEGGSKYQFFQAYSWVYDDTLAMHRIVFGGVFENHPNLKIIVHHHGAMIPYFSGRVDTGVAFFEKNMGFKYPTAIEMPYKEHYSKFYIDTATQFYNPETLKIAIDYFGADHTLFGSDAPMDAESGKVMIDGAYDSIAALHFDEETENQIYFENAKALFRI